MVPSLCLCITLLQRGLQNCGQVRLVSVPTCWQDAISRPVAAAIEASYVPTPRRALLLPAAALANSCHICRQCRPCKRPDCARCTGRDVGQRCLDKTWCHQCRSATGMLCMNCLKLRYGTTFQVDPDGINPCRL